jgi:hypothetical protein
MLPTFLVLWGRATAVKYFTRLVTEEVKKEVV